MTVVWGQTTIVRALVETFVFHHPVSINGHRHRGGQGGGQSGGRRRKVVWGGVDGKVALIFSVGNFVRSFFIFSGRLIPGTGNFHVS